MRNYKIDWEELEYEFFDKNSDWFWALGIVSIAVAVTAIILNNILFAILILVGAFALGIHSVKKPEIVHYEVNQRGIIIDNKLYPYNSLDSFWIEHNPEDPKLLITSKKVLMPQIVIRINLEVDTDDLRDYLLDHVDEEEQKESFATTIMDYLGF